MVILTAQNKVFWLFFIVMLMSSQFAKANCGGVELHAHRGHPAHPENSLSAVHAITRSEGWHGVEVDVQQLGSGQWVLHHDPVLGRVTTLAGRRTTQLTDVAWREVRLKTREGRISEETGAFLEDAVAAAKVGEVVLNVEIKQEMNCQDISRLVKDLSRQIPEGRWFLTSIRRNDLTCARAADPDGYLGLIVIDPRAVARSDPRTRRAADRLVGPRIDQPWLQSLQRDVGGLVGVHVDVETLDEHTSLLSNAYSLRMPVFSYSLAGDKIHLDVLKRHGNRYGYWPSGAIIDGDANTFCRTLQAAHR